MKEKTDILCIILVVLFVFTDPFKLIGIMINFILVHFDSVCNFLVLVYTIWRDRKKKE